ncbi:MAG: hypothetical protein RL354_1555, partial [Planctomycetota bacterium]
MCNAFGIETFIPPTSLLRIVCERFRRDSWKTLLLVPRVEVGSSRSKFESGSGVANRIARARRRAPCRSVSAGFARHGDRETEARIAQYELAYRMQTAVPEAMDLTRESAQTLEEYGAAPG